MKRRSLIKAFTLSASIAAMGMTWTVQAAETIKVGILHSLSGTMAISETSLKDMALMTIDEINAKGGVNGKMLDPVVVDPASNWPLFAENSQPTRKAGARPSDILAQVLNSGGLRVLLESKTWLERGVVASDFTIRTDAIADEFDWDAPDQAQAPAPPPTGGPLDPWHDEL